MESAKVVSLPKVPPPKGTIVLQKGTTRQKEKKNTYIGIFIESRASTSAHKTPFRKGAKVPVIKSFTISLSTKTEV